MILGCTGDTTISPRLIYCHGGNAKAAAVAKACGWETGSRSDKAIYEEARPLALLDIEWRGYDWMNHLAVARTERPWLAAVPDVETTAQLSIALEQAEELAPYCDRLLVIPKVFGLTAQLPRSIGGNPLVLGFSVPTKYGGTSVPLHEFDGWPVHLLGGNPRNQRFLAARLSNVMSVDGNVCHKLSMRGVYYSDRGSSSPSIERMDGKRWHDNAEMPYEALRRSLTNLKTFWGIRE